MPRTRYVARPRPEKAERPFETVAEAWFWSARSLAARAEGAVFAASAAAFARPCEPDDVVRVALDLARRRRLGPHHLKALARFGAAAAPPDVRLPEDAWALRPWDEALDRLTAPLRAKGIVASPRVGDGVAPVPAPPPVREGVE